MVDAANTHWYWLDIVANTPDRSGAFTRASPASPLNSGRVVRHQQVHQDGRDQQADRGEVAPQPSADQEGERKRQQPAGHGRGDPRDGERQVPAADIQLEAAVGGVRRQGQDRGYVGSRRLEDDEAEVRDAGDAELLAQSEAGHGVHRAVHQQGDE